MKRKTVNKLFAAGTAGFLFTNASIAANAEEMPEESGVVSEQNVVWMNMRPALCPTIILS